MERFAERFETLKEGAGRLLFDTAAEGLLLVDRTGKILIANAQLEHMFGYGDGELTGQPVEVLIPGAIRERHREHRSAYNKAPKKRSMGRGLDLQAVRKDGTEFPVEVSLNHMKDQGELLIMGLVTDISDRKRAEQRLYDLNQSLEGKVEERTRELKESQYLYRTIARNFPNGTINVFDRKLRYVFAEGQELFRYKLTSENLVGTSYLERLPEDVREEIHPKLQRVFEGEDMSFEIETRGQNYMMNAVGLPDARGNIQQVLVVEQNISAQKKAQQRIRDALDKERELNELKSRFVSMASHEFRTPLSTILTSVSLLKRYNETEEVEKRLKHLNRIRTSVQNLTTILNDFLSLDKLEEGRVQTNNHQVAISDLMADLVEEMETHCKAGQTIELHSSIACSINSDEHILRNVLINLLSNAIKYSPENTTVEVGCHLEGENVALTVKDAGIGIPLDEQEHLFSRFFRASNAVNIQGTGLGLHIVKRYVELLGGDITFESVPSKGTEFTLTFPMTAEA